jgi:hypothetical protein
LLICLQINPQTIAGKVAARKAALTGGLRSNVRCGLYELAVSGPAPIASEALERIAGLYAVEKDIRGRSPEERRTVLKSRPLIDALEPWLRAKLGLISQKSKLARAIRYALTAGSSSTTTPSSAPSARSRSTGRTLFAGSDGGAEHWATIASLIETCKLNDIDPLAYLTDVLTRIVNGHPNRDIDQLLPLDLQKARPQSRA